MTVALVLVSHVPEIAEGVRRLAAQMAPDVWIGVAGGDDDGGIGTSFDKVSAALEDARCDDGTVVLYDLGSAQLTAETAVEMLADEQVRIVDAPLVEGALAAATAAQQGADLAEVAGAAEQQYVAPFRLEGLEGAVAAEPGPDALTADVTLTNPLGLHARPAADLARLVGERDAVVLLAGESREWVDARSVVAVIGLGLRGGDVVRLAAHGPQAAEALRAAVQLVASSFGEAATGNERTTLSGVAAAPGAAVGPAVPVVVALRPSDAPAATVDAESQRLAAAIDAADARLAAVDEVFAPIAAAHRTLLTDPMLRGRASALVERGSSAAQAWTTAVDEAYGVLSGVADAEMAARAADVLDVGARVTAALEGREFDAGLPRADELAGAVLVAEELLPSQVVQAHAAGVAAFVAGRGSEGAHAAQLARSLGLPAVLGVGDAVRTVRPGQRLRVDGVRGQVEVDDRR